MTSSRYLNIGCGHHRHPDWVNVDMYDSGGGIIVHDLRTPLPFADGTFEVVYHSHALEHFDREQGERLLRECRRVLAPGGVLRVVVPDLEQIARAYLAALDEVSRSRSEVSAANHEWMVIEMVDQLARHQSGGEVSRYIARPDVANLDFVGARWGAEGKGLIADHAAARRAPGQRAGRFATMLARLRQVRKYPMYLRELALLLILGRGYKVWALGRYRLAGDVHLWMYDRVSLAATLERCGFGAVIERRADESYVTDWRRFNLDTGQDGSVYRPNSLFMEGRAARRAEL